jgi:WXG100 family type VII secretion target
MSGKSRVSAAELRDLAGRIDTVKSEIQGVIGKLNGVAGEVQAAWAGAGGSAYQSLQAQVNNDATVLNRILGDIRDALAATATDFTTNDEQQEQVLKQLQGSTQDDAIAKAFG